MRQRVRNVVLAATSGAMIAAGVAVGLSALMMGNAHNGARVTASTSVATQDLRAEAFADLLPFISARTMLTICDHAETGGAEAVYDYISDPAGSYPWATTSDRAYEAAAFVANCEEIR